MINEIKIISVDTPLFEYKGIEYSVEEVRFKDFAAFQDEIGRMLKKGATHLFIYKIWNVKPDGTSYCGYPDGEDIRWLWVRYCFKKN